MASRLSIFHPPGVLSLKANPFGKDVANLELYRALARHGGFERIDMLSARPADGAATVEALLGDQPSATQVVTDVILNPGPPMASGALLRGQPFLAELAWLRRRVAGDRGYSLLGLVHTVAPPAIRELIAASLVAPIQPWDAIICTSPSVRENLETLFESWGGYLAERTGGAPPVRPALPVVPLGVDLAAQAGLADRPGVRAERRAALGVGDDDILALWVGRLSFFEKAFPQPMFQALQRAAAETGAKVTFAMAGWFPAPEDRGRYEQAARLHAPDVQVVFLDGNDRVLLGELWAAGDIFLSLVDNIQETFGITPLEAMAAGMPVVVSDWDGYRSTVRDGIEGFLIPTLGGPPGPIGEAIAARHGVGLESYQSYVGAVAQHTAVHVGRAAEAIADLVRSPDLRKRMGAAGRARVRDAFDWPVVVRQINTLLRELAQVRAGAPQEKKAHRLNPLRGDPFADFAGFATHGLDVEGVMRVRPGVGVADLERIARVDLDKGFAGWRANLDEARLILDRIASGETPTVRAVLLSFPVERRRYVQMCLVWMAKLGLLDWL